MPEWVCSEKLLMTKGLWLNSKGLLMIYACRYAGWKCSMRLPLKVIMARGWRWFVGDAHSIPNLPACLRLDEIDEATVLDHFAIDL